ncbi:MAG: hypothetical protein PHE17_14545 [Thiothrix sp.]|jgi:hypothetical protein|uniref:hypothetical protein n=1 Tax=Thiothrix sp. TaxID=1032 RepID=UPI0026189629|nr:hypothetical protein [Thiothrix sp.]MDD5394229.1 hypothetical protein [Thiothrix sp.]
MQRNGIRIGCYGLLILLVWFLPASADETADEITEMMSWWDEYGSYWDDANELIEFAGEDSLYMLAENTVENSE